MGNIKVFRLFQDRDLQDWEDRGEPYGPAVIESINNPDGDYSKNDPTSIPSPFARIDLVRSAFKYVNDSGNFDGNTIYHKLVSDTFDVAEMFFNIDKYGGKARITAWDRDTDLKALLNSNNPKHRLFGETIELFLIQDADSNNFNDLEKLYFLFYDNKIIGGTSPTTFFFTTANDLSFVDFGEGNDVFFDADLRPLHKRDPEFQLYLHRMLKAYPGLSSKMRDFSEHLTQSLKRLEEVNREAYLKIGDLEKADSVTVLADLQSSLKALNTGEEGDNVKVLGKSLLKRKIGSVGSSIQESSQLVIASDKAKLRPLVLQNNLSEPLIYTSPNVVWNSNWVVPYFNDTPLDKRTLPGQLDVYPYITVSDFLQPYIIRLPYPLNADNYFNGNVTYESGDKNMSYLLPLSEMFFEYFDTLHLQRPLPNGLPMIEMKVYANSVDVTLRIPILGNATTKHITLSRTYQNKGVNDVAPDVSKNQGQILDNKISLVVHPFVESLNDENSHYRVMLLDSDNELTTKYYSYELDFYKNSSLKPLEKEKTSRSIKDQNNIQTDFYSVNKGFDYVMVRQNSALGIVIPNLKSAKGTAKLKFAIDFGTTNTHIEYKINDEGPYPFEITAKDIQYATLHLNNDEVKNNAAIFTDVNEMNGFIRHEFLPEFIGDEAEFKFPIRTVTGEDEKLDFGSIPQALADINIPFDYEKYASKSNTNIETNLKWSDFQDVNSENKVRVEKFIEKLILLVRAKVLRMNGNLKKTEIIWFYPSSMDGGKVNKLEDTWNLYFNKYFGSERTTRLSESIAPFYFYRNMRNIDASHKPVVSVDIGGGTSDIVVFKEKDPIMLTSAKYAANSIFGDGYGGSPQTNGFVHKYQKEIENLLDRNGLSELLGAYKQIYKKNKSEDLIAFYFSLANHREVNRKKVPLQFDKFLSDDQDLKIVFIIFYSSLIYHIAKLMKTKNLDSPRDIIFSGTGSKVILIANGSKNLNSLNKLTELIFTKVYGGDLGHTVKITLEEQPKEITCKGGLEIDKKIEDVSDIKDVLVGDSQDTLISTNGLSYRDLNDELKQNVKDESLRFVDMIFSLNDELNFKNSFGVNPGNLDLYKKIMTEDVLSYLGRGITQKKDNLSGNDSIDLEESLFFYPLVGSLNKLAHVIATSKD